MKTLLKHFIKLQKITTVMLIALSFVLVSASKSFAQDNSQIKAVTCYPNPATSYISFDFKKNIGDSYMLQLYSFSGRKMAESPVNNGKITITLTEFFRGIYVYQLRDKQGRIVESGKFQVVK